jgi:hypothetical protein
MRAPGELRRSLAAPRRAVAPSARVPAVRASAEATAPKPKPKAPQQMLVRDQPVLLPLWPAGLAQLPGDSQPASRT